jgi:hypothetical protein
MNIKLQSSESELRKSNPKLQSQLFTSPHIQAAAIAYLGVYVTYTLDEKDADDYTDKGSQVIEDCYKVMGISENSPFADHVSSAIRELSDKMRGVLVKTGQLRCDCSEAWQAQKAA